MKNLQKLSRKELSLISGGDGDETARTCHLNYTGTLWGEDMVITSVGDGPCPKSGRTKCYSYTQTGPKCEK
ncbi:MULTISPECIES: hypothetical protein [Chryseobacterium]|uniref:Bacteriocin n=1 Tax=Chryseobacterium camelliae TaxID=1265445 RepID=A0ABU0TIK3_9FLAO|nr:MULTISPECIES: hypothetical protein [Chryseobacterium]MDT3409260.1 hypothetical protein [Pseudacidovorax intermedius]MDQ1096878.1 hypothetical protein [Chryseobacterium camelliae]MDQ1100820.1 hypothetical protein [Chryseobacterium sp. SORGH_AS_1048]MDR6084261.1 hypothetical protein [Chryseobacterium sp. SORGH_AS_0909]MDR6132534.1 hypothetical protein [Chryseobacterium sp. SORGH_AS_1175]